MFGDLQDCTFFIATNGKIFRPDDFVYSCSCCSAKHFWNLFCECCYVL